MYIFNKETVSTREGKYSSKNNKFIAPVPFITLMIDEGEKRTELKHLSIGPSIKFGLDHLGPTYKIFIQRADKKFPFRTHMKLNRFYEVLDQDGITLFYAAEALDFPSRCWRGMQRRYCIYFFTPSGTLTFTLERQRLRSCSRLAPTQEAVSANVFNAPQRDLNVSMVHSGTGKFIGRLQDLGSCLSPRLVLDEKYHPGLLTLRGKCFGNTCPSLIPCRNSKFKIYDKHGYKVGSIFNRSRVPPEILSTGKTFYAGAAFPKEISEITKALIITSTFELNISYFRRKCSCETVFHFFLCLWTVALLAGTALFILWREKIIDFNKLKK